MRSIVGLDYHHATITGLSGTDAGRKPFSHSDELVQICLKNIVLIERETETVIFTTHNSHPNLFSYSQPTSISSPICCALSIPRFD